MNYGSIADKLDKLTSRLHVKLYFILFYDTVDASHIPKGRRIYILQFELI